MPVQFISRFIGVLSLVVICSCDKTPPAPLPTANFFVSNNGCTAPCTVHFFDQSENAINWKWIFGNGSTSTKQNDSVAYSTAGTYEVWLYSFNTDDVADSVRKNVTVN